jgi:hypothetical protein
VKYYRYTWKILKALLYKQLRSSKWPWFSHLDFLTKKQYVCITGADPRFQVGGAHLKKIAQSRGRREIFGVFRVKNHDFTPKNHIFSNFRGGGVHPARTSPLDPPLYHTLLLYKNMNSSPVTSGNIKYDQHIHRESVIQ